MPTYKRQIKSPGYIDTTIVEENGNIVGMIRLKPSNILWKPKNGKKMFSISLDKFIEWISDENTKAKKVGS